MGVRRLASIVGFIMILILPISIWFYEFSNDLGQSNPFIMALIILSGLIIGLVGLFICWFSMNGLNKKIYATISALLIYLVIMPVVWKVNDIRLMNLIDRDQESLKSIAQSLLVEELDIEDANEILKESGSNLVVYCIPDEKEHVLFIISGLIDNCVGISYSIAEKEPTYNCCGELRSWTKVKGNWYRWVTT